MKNSMKKTLGMAMLSIAVLASSCTDSGTDPIIDEPTSTFILNPTDLKGNINDGEVVLEAGTYKLTGKLQVNNGAKLRIKAGAKIEATTVTGATGESIRYIAVAQGGQIFVEGTSTNPVVMTADVKAPESWGGLVICGKAPINKGTTGVAEVSDLTYGGTVANDNSGSIKYLRIEYSGYRYSSTKEFNGLSLFGVGNGTTIEYVQSYEGSDDGFEWFGGTVNAKYLVVNNAASAVGDDMFDWTEGWVGTGEYWYGVKKNAGNRGIEADNNADNQTATPYSSPTIKNITLIGNLDTDPEPQGIKLRVGTKGILDNVVLSKWKVGIDVENDVTLANVTAGTLKVTNVRFDQVTTKATAKTSAGVTTDLTAVYTENASATGAGNGTGVPTWAAGWTVGL